MSDLVKYAVGMTLSAVVAYFAATYGLQERIRVAEVRRDEDIAVVKEYRGELRELAKEMRELAGEVRELKVLATRSRR